MDNKYHVELFRFHTTEEVDEEISKLTELKASIDCLFVTGEGSFDDASSSSSPSFSSTSILRYFLERLVFQVVLSTIPTLKSLHFSQHVPIGVEDAKLIVAISQLNMTKAPESSGIVTFVESLMTTPVLSYLSSLAKYHKTHVPSIQLTKCLWSPSSNTLTSKAQKANNQDDDDNNNNNDEVLDTIQLSTSYFPFDVSLQVIHGRTLLTVKHARQLIQASNELALKTSIKTQVIQFYDCTLSTGCFSYLISQAQHKKSSFNKTCKIQHVEMVQNCSFSTFVPNEKLPIVPQMKWVLPDNVIQLPSISVKNHLESFTALVTLLAKYKPFTNVVMLQEESKLADSSNAINSELTMIASAMNETSSAHKLCVWNDGVISNQDMDLLAANLQNDTPFILLDSGSSNSSIGSNSSSRPRSGHFFTKWHISRQSSLNFACQPRSFNDECLKQLASAITTNTTLVQLDLSQNINNITDTGLEYIIQALQRHNKASNVCNTTLKYVSTVKCNQLSEDLLDELNFYLTLNRLGRRQLLEQSDLPIGLFLILFGKVHHNPSIIFWMLRTFPQLFMHKN